MGNTSAPVSSTVEVDDYKKSRLLSHHIKRFAQLMESNPDLRELFARYISSEKWMKFVLEHRHSNIIVKPTSESIEQCATPTSHPADTSNEPHFHDIRTTTCNSETDPCPSKATEIVQPYLFYHLPHSEAFEVPSVKIMSSKKRRLSLFTTRKSNRVRSSFEGHPPTSRLFRSAAGGRNEEKSDRGQHAEEIRGIHFVLWAAIIPSFMEDPQFIEWHHRHVRMQSMVRMKSVLKSAHNFLVTSQSKLSGVHDQDDDEDEDQNDKNDDQQGVDSIEKLLVRESEQGVDSPSTPQQPVRQFHVQDPLFIGHLRQLVTLLHVDQVSKQFESAAWLDRVVQFVDALPFMVSIASGQKKKGLVGSTSETFPLIYVNKTFESLTGYTRQEVLGKNCRFLQREECTEMQQVEKLHTALHNLQPVRVAITNARKDGHSFLNFVSLMPVMSAPNERGERKCSYVVSSGYDILRHQSQRFPFEFSLTKRRRSRLDYIPMDIVADDLHCIDTLMSLFALLVADSSSSLS